MARSSRRATTRIALVAADRHRARVASSGRYHAWPSVRSARPRDTDRAGPVLLPPGYAARHRPPVPPGPTPWH